MIAAQYRLLTEGSDLLTSRKLTEPRFRPF
jgi:hypothetical protein